MADIVVNDIASLVIANIVTTLSSATIAGQAIFATVGVVDNPQSFIAVADVLKASPLASVGIVQGTLDEQNGTSDFEYAVCRLPLLILVRFKFIKKPTDTHKGATDRMSFLMEAIKVALLVDDSRGGNCNLIQWGGTAIPGTTVKGTAQALSKIENEAFFTASVAVSCAWSRTNSYLPPLDFQSLTDEQFENMQ